MPGLHVVKQIVFTVALLILILSGDRRVYLSAGGAHMNARMPPKLSLNLDTACGVVFAFASPVNGFRWASVFRR